MPLDRSQDVSRIDVRDLNKTFQLAGTAIERVTRGAVSGLVLVTAMTIRTDMQIQSLTFTASAAKRATLEVSMSLVHVPRPGVVAKVLDIAALGVGALSDFVR